MTDTPQTPPGWYHAEGDPVGTQRWWDGTQWIGAPQLNAPTQGVPGGPASPAKRIGGRIIDAIIAGVLFSLPLAIVTFSRIDLQELADELESGSGNFGSVFGTSVNQAADINPLFPVALGAAYFVWEWLWVALRGATPGKLMVGTRVSAVDPSEIPPGHRAGVLRALNRIFGAVPIVSFIFPLIGLASFVMLFAHPQRRTVMDLIAGTVVVEKP